MRRGAQRIHAAAVEAFNRLNSSNATTTARFRSAASPRQREHLSEPVDVSGRVT
jgi:hypothetical protein